MCRILGFLLFWMGVGLLISLMIRSSFLTVLAAALLLLSACGQAAAPAETSGAEETASAGILSSFDTVDLDGNAVDQGVFSEHKLTMVNIWATYCGPCISEMPDLGILAEEYEDKGLQVMGLVSDVLDSDGNLSEEQLEKAREIVESTGADYTHIVPGEGTYGLLSQIYAVPTTLFVDSEGRQVGSAYMSAKSLDDWKEIADGLLEGLEQ